MKTIVLDDFIEKDENRISIIFLYDEKLITIARSIHAIWSPSKRFWHIKKNKENINRIYSMYPSIAEINNKFNY